MSERTNRERTVRLYFGKLVEGALLQRVPSDTHEIRLTLRDGIPVYVEVLQLPPSQQPKKLRWRRTAP